MATSRVCETVTARSMDDLLAARDAATAGDMVELRLDGVADVDVPRALAGRRVPVVATCRARWEGGQFDGSEEERCRILAAAHRLGAEFVDVEWKAFSGPSADGFRDLIRADAARVLVSSHDFEGVPADLDTRAREMRAIGAGTIKVAVAVGRLSDTLRLRRIAEGGPAVVIGMGDLGVPSRLLAGRYGSCWTYSGNGVAPGQLPARRMIEDYGFRRIGSSTRLFGVVSTNALHSLSPAMHNAAFEAAGLDGVYVPLPTNQFDDFLEFAAALGIEGASITVPFKLDALRAAADADDLTRRVGAANTLRRRPGGEWDAINTDVAGFLEPLEAALESPLAGARVAVLGGGGSARAVVVALADRGANVTVYTRRPEQGRELAASFGVAAGGPVPDARSWDILVNCTPLGGAGLRSESPLPGGPFTGRLVYDLTYGPGESALVREAREAGCVVLDGLPMLAAQAKQQFEWWTGQAPGPGVLEKAARQRMSTGGTRAYGAAVCRGE